MLNSVMHISFKLFPALLILILTFPLKGQIDTAVVTKNFLFSDGVYLSFDAFQNNQPSYHWDELEVQVFTNPQTHEAKWTTPVLISSGTPLEEHTIWGICREGIPYIRLADKQEQQELTTFAALRVRGKICYFSYLTIEEREIEVSAYNPYTGRPFRTGVIRREEEVTQERMLHFETGAITDFTLGNFLDWILDDPGLHESVLELTEEEVEEKLFRCLLIYDDRNPVFTNKG